MADTASVSLDDGTWAQSDPECAENPGDEAARMGGVIDRHSSSTSAYELAVSVHASCI
jgi:hypothetical protein